MSLAATWIQLEVIILSEVSQKEKDKYHMISHMCILKCGTTIYATKQTHRHKEQTWLSRGLGEGWTWSLGLVDANYYM